MDWKPEFAVSGCIKVKLTVRTADHSLILKQDGAGYWCLSLMKNIPHDEEQVSKVLLSFIQAEAAWASHKPYKTPPLKMTTTEEFVDCESPPFHGVVWSQERAVAWANKMVAKKWPEVLG